MKPFDEGITTQKLPVSISLENHPKTKTLSFIVNTGGVIQKCQFAEMKNDFRGLKFYVAGNEIGHSYVINSFQITSFINIPNPTNFPSLVPSTSPTDRPTDFPTCVPTTDPTQVPSNVPTQYPSMNPTDVPSTFPTMNPSRFPTIS